MVISLYELRQHLESLGYNCLMTNKLEGLFIYEVIDTRVAGNLLLSVLFHAEQEEGCYQLVCSGSVFDYVGNDESGHALNHLMRCSLQSKAIPASVTVGIKPEEGRFRVSSAIIIDDQNLTPEFLAHQLSAMRDGIRVVFDCMVDYPQVAEACRSHQIKYILSMLSKERQFGLISIFVDKLKRGLVGSGDLLRLNLQVKNGNFTEICHQLA